MPKLRTSRSQPGIRADRKEYGPRRAIPGYRGYCPGKVSEHLNGGLFSAIQAASRHVTSKLSHDQQELQHLSRARKDFESGRIASQPSLCQTQPGYRPSGFVDKRGNDDEFLGYVPGAGDYRESRVLNAEEIYYEEPPMSNNLKAKTNLIGYTGYIPGKRSENCFGNGWTKENLNSTSAHDRTTMGRNGMYRSDPLAIEKGMDRLRPRAWYDAQQNRRLKGLFVKDMTHVERVESDNQKEIPLFFTNYNDMKRGWSTCPWTGSQIDPAGREGPVNRQEGWNCVQPPFYDKAPKYQGYCPGKRAENVFAERQATVESISKHRVEKNRIRKLQR